jgi:hypothetical protein
MIGNSSILRLIWSPDDRVALAQPVVMLLGWRISRSQNSLRVSTCVVVDVGFIGIGQNSVGLIFVPGGLYGLPMMRVGVQII